MEACAANFKKLCQLNTPLIHYVAEALRCCKEPNWWHPVINGPDYIYMWLVGWRQALYEKCSDAQHALDKLTAAILDKDKIGAAKCWYLLQGTKRKPGTTAQVAVGAINCKTGRPSGGGASAISICRSRPRWPWTRISSAKRFVSLRGRVPTAHHTEPVTAGECRDLINGAAKKQEHPETIPTWCCDGIHCAGNATRFSGSSPVR